MLLRNLVPDPATLTLAQLAYVRHRASVDFVVYNRVTNQPLLAIEVAGFAFHENKPEQQERDALKDEILAARQMPLLRLATTGSREPGAPAHPAGVGRRRSPLGTPVNQVTPALRRRPWDG